MLIDKLKNNRYGFEQGNRRPGAQGPGTPIVSGGMGTSPEGNPYVTSPFALKNFMNQVGMGTGSNGAGGNYGNSFLGTYMNLAKNIVPSTTNELIKRKKATLDLENQSLLDRIKAMAGLQAQYGLSPQGTSSMTGASQMVAPSKWGQSSGSVTHTPSAYAGSWNQPIVRDSDTQDARIAAANAMPIQTVDTPNVAPGEFSTRAAGMRPQAQASTEPAASQTAQAGIGNEDQYEYYLAEDGTMQKRKKVLQGQDLTADTGTDMGEG